MSAPYVTSRPSGVVTAFAPGFSRAKANASANAPSNAVDEEEDEKDAKVFPRHRFGVRLTAADETVAPSAPPIRRSSLVVALRIDFPPPLDQL
jgi:hypothetical protein